MTSVETLMQAEIERLREQNASQSVHIIAQGGEIEGLREDAERYRWLRDKFSRIACNVNLAWDAAQAETIKIESLWVMEHFRATDPESTDTAIDAARKGTT